MNNTCSFKVGLLYYHSTSDDTMNAPSLLFEQRMPRNYQYFLHLRVDFLRHPARVFRQSSRSLQLVIWEGNNARVSLQKIYRSPFF